MYSGAFTGSYGKAVDETGVWEMTLSLLSEEDIAFGLKKLMLDDSYQQFPPNPKQFKALCIDKQRLLGLPSTKDAYLEARMFFDCKTHIWSHHSVKFSAIKTGEDLLVSAREQVAWPRFKEIYERAVLAVKNGIQLPRLDIKEETKQMNLAVGRHYLNQIKQQLHGA